MKNHDGVAAFFTAAVRTPAVTAGNSSLITRIMPVAVDIFMRYPALMKLHTNERMKVKAAFITEYHNTFRAKIFHDMLNHVPVLLSEFGIICGMRKIFRFNT